MSSQALIDNLLGQGARSDVTALADLFIARWREGTQRKRSETPSVCAFAPSSAEQVHKGSVTSSSRLPQDIVDQRLRRQDRALRQAWDQDDANKAERHACRNLAIDADLEP